MIMKKVDLFQWLTLWTLTLALGSHYLFLYDLLVGHTPAPLGLAVAQVRPLELSSLFDLRHQNGVPNFKARSLPVGWVYELPSKTNQLTCNLFPGVPIRDTKEQTMQRELAMYAAIKCIEIILIKDKGLFVWDAQSQTVESWNLA